MCLTLNVIEEAMGAITSLWVKGKVQNFLQALST